VARGRVLIIEQEEWEAALLTRFLSEAGYEVHVAGEARAGFDKVRELQPDCILCNVNLPDIDGFWVARRVRTEPTRVATTPFLFLTEADDAESRLQGLNVGADLYLTKPFRNDEVVAQVGAVSGLTASGPVPVPPQMLEDGIKRARTGQGAEVDGGFSFRSKIDMWSNQLNREFRPGALLDRIPEGTKILWIPAEKDELIPPRGANGPYAGAKAFKGISQVAELPYITHFQMYSFTAFEVGSTLAADWFLKYLGEE